MCFSPEVSFAASGILITIGAATIYKTQNNKQKLFSSLPLFFGIQQFSEGILWLALMGKISSIFIPYATYAYLFFAQIFWPIWIPLSMLVIEKKQIHKKLLNVSLIFGATISSTFTYSLIKYGVTPSIEGHHIFYHIQTPINTVYCLIFYVISVTLPFLISSRNFMRFFGILNLISLVATYLFYHHWLTSIWCFFAAVLSCIIYLAVVKRKI